MRHLVKIVPVISLLLILNASDAYTQTPVRRKKPDAHAKLKDKGALKDETWQCTDKPLPPDFEIVREIREKSCHTGRANVIRQSSVAATTVSTVETGKSVAVESSEKQEDIDNSATPLEIVDLAANQKSYVSKYVRLTGQLTVSSKYDHGYRQAQSTHLSFMLKDETGEAFVYIRRGRVGELVQEQILKSANNIMHGTFVVRLNPDRYETSSDVYADLIIAHPAER